MRTWALDFLRCPETGSGLKLVNPRFQGDHVMEGALLSSSGSSYPIVNGIPRLVLGFNTEKEKRTAELFGEEWNIYHGTDGYFGSKDLFFDFVRGLSPVDFKDKIVLDAGCGSGRFDKVISSLGPKYVIAMDFSDSVEASFNNTKDLENVLVVQGSILEPPFSKEIFDLIVTIGVVDHMPDTKKALEVLKGLMHKEGKLSFWVYAFEGNEFYLKFAKPFRSITTKFPKSILLAISYLLSVPIWFYAHTINKMFGLKKDGTMRLPMAHYFLFLQKFKLKDITAIVYDQLGPDLADYIPKKQLEQWIDELKLKIENFVFRNSNSYSVLTKKRKKYLF